MTMKKLIFLFAFVCTLAVCAQTENGHEYVDLGLPSGTVWATCNLGAETPYDFGGTYAWGESADYGTKDPTNKKNYSTFYSEAKYQFGWHTYKYAPLSNEAKYENRYVTKYCQNKSYWAGEGEPDMLNKLAPEDDAANVLWGGHWKMPTKEQLLELQNSNCVNWEWKTVNGTSGVKITSKVNGKSIFLPASGFRSFNAKTDNSDSRYNYNSVGYYWSSMRSSTAYKATYMNFSNRDGEVIANNLDENRWTGLAIRPVFAQAPVIVEPEITVIPGYDNITVEWTPVTTQQDLTYKVYVSGNALQLTGNIKYHLASNTETITNNGESKLRCTVKRFFYDRMMYDIMPDVTFYVTVVVYNEKTERSSTYSVKTTTTLAEDPDNPANRCDVNGDKVVNSTDVVCVYNYIALGEASGIAKEKADVNGDGTVNTTDIVAIYNSI